MAECIDLTGFTEQEHQELASDKTRKQSAGRWGGKGHGEEQSNGDHQLLGGDIQDPDEGDQPEEVTSSEYLVEPIPTEESSDIEINNNHIKNGIGYTYGKPVNV